MAKITGYVITAGHLDIEWYQPLCSYRFWTAEALETLKRIDRERHDFTCYVLDGQVFPLEEYLEVVPEDESAMRALIASGKLAIGPFYTQFDEWLPSAECIIRNCLYGNRKSLAMGGIMRAGYLPDNFGHPMQMPQILRGFDIDSLLFMRGFPEVPGGHPDEFIYRGIDGSEVLASHFRETYAGAFDIFQKKADPLTPREVPYYADYLGYEYFRELAVHDDPQRIARNMIQNVHRIKERYPSGVIALVAGYDHLPPQINVGDSIRAANEMQDEIEFVMGDAEGYVREVKKALRSPAVYGMELIGSRYQYILLGALSTRTYLKRAHFACEALLERYAEPLDAMASLLGYPDKPALLHQAWRSMLINSAHDSIHGSSVDEVHVEMDARYGTVRQIAAGIIHDAMKHMGARMPLPPTGRAMLRYAPVRSAHPQVCEVWLPVGDDPVSVARSDGRVLPTQILSREKIALNGKGQPRNAPYHNSVLRKLLFLDDAGEGALAMFTTTEAAAPKTALRVSERSIENEFIRVDVEGALMSIFDKRTGKSFENLNLLEEDAEAGDAWDHSPPWTHGEKVLSTAAAMTARITERGPVRATIAMEGVMSVPARLIGDERSQARESMPISFEVAVCAGVPRVDVKLTLDNRARDHRVRLCVPMGVVTDAIRSQSQLAVIDRAVRRPVEIEPWHQPPTVLLPFREWVAAQDGSAGLAVALKGVYDYEAQETACGQPRACFTLLRGFELMGRMNMPARSGGASPSSHTPGAQCIGEHIVEWAYMPYAADADDRAPFLGLAQCFLYPPVVHALREPQVDKATAVCPDLFSWTEKNIQFSAFKRCFDRDGCLLRLYENQGRKTTARVRVNGFTRAALCDMNERTLSEVRIENGVITLHFEPYKALSVKII